MEKVLILNPAAGHGDARNIEKDGIESYLTQSIGDAERFVRERCLTAPETHFIVCGGDGTVTEVVSRNISAGAAEKAAFSVIPTGSGNDFVKSADHDGEPVKIDLIEYNGRYCVNMLNIGFDSNVVKATEKYKKKHRGTTAYLLGVLDVLFHKLGSDFDIKYVDENGNQGSRIGSTLLCALANGRYCGGGFQFAPKAELDDGLIDLLIVNVVSRIKFISIFSQFRKGEYLNEDGTINKRFKNVLECVKCSSVSISGMTDFCADGEIESDTHVDARIAPRAITYIGL